MPLDAQGPDPGLLRQRTELVRRVRPPHRERAVVARDPVSSDAPRRQPDEEEGEPRPQQIVDDHAEAGDRPHLPEDRKSTRLNSSHSQISYAVFCLKKKKNKY